MKNTTKTIVILLLLFVVILFAVINAQPITINFIFAKQRVPLVLIIMISVILGAIIALIGTVGTIWKKNKAVKDLTNQLTEIKSTPVDEVTAEKITSLENQLKDSEAEISDLRHKLVNQMMTPVSEADDVSAKTTDMTEE